MGSAKIVRIGIALLVAVSSTLLMSRDLLQTQTEGLRNSAHTEPV